MKMVNEKADLSDIKVLKAQEVTLLVVISVFDIVKFLDRIYKTRTYLSSRMK